MTDLKLDTCLGCGNSLNAVTQFSHSVCITCSDGNVMRAKAIAQEGVKARGCALLMETVTLARSGRGYKQNLKELKAYVQASPDVAKLVKHLAESLG